MFSTDTRKAAEKAAREINVEAAALLAIIEIESGGKGFSGVGKERRPIIRFEGHYFDKRLSPEKQDRARKAGLSSSIPGAIRNPSSQAERWRLLEQAADIDRNAAYESTSWGMGQVMGAHWSWLGFNHVQALVTQAFESEAGQINLLQRYLVKASLIDALRQRDWVAVARGYNGPGYAANSYHLRLGLAYRRHLATPAEQDMPPQTDFSDQNWLRKGDLGEKIKDLQILLTAAGYPVKIDSVFGPETHAAVLRFQRAQTLVVDGIVGPATLGALIRINPFKTLFERLLSWMKRVRRDQKFF